MTLSVLAAFWAVSFLFIITPGADWAYAISAGMRGRWVTPAVAGLLSGHLLATIIVAAGVGGVAPTWQLLRTASQWKRCGAEPFEIPPTEGWANIVAALRYVGAFVLPKIGVVEPVSVYRNPRSR